MWMRGDKTSQHAHRRTGVAAIKRSGGLLKRAASASNLNRLVCVVSDLGSKGFHAGERGVRVGACGEVREARRACGNTGKHGVAVRDGFVTGEGDRTLQRTGWTDYLCG